MTWQELIEREPKLLDLEAELQAITDEGGATFCANAVWHGFGQYSGRGFKSRLSELVNYGDRGAALTHDFAARYDAFVAYQKGFHGA